MHVRSLVLLSVTAVGLVAAPVTAKVAKDVAARAVGTVLEGAKSSDFTTRAMAVEALAYVPKKQARP